MEWKTIRRETGLIEHVCEHGAGHANVASAFRVAYHCINNPLYYGEGDLKKEAWAWTVHCCDGCCHSKDFPGGVINTIEFSFNLYEEQMPGYLDLVDDNIVDYLQAKNYLELKQYLLSLPYFDDTFKRKCEFMYWGLKALVEDDTI